MYYYPELAPLLDRTRYAMKAEFILPLMLGRLTEKGNELTHTLEFEVRLTGVSEPILIKHEIPLITPNKNYSIVLNPLFLKAGIDPKADGYMLIRSSTPTPASFPNLIVAVGHWISYHNKDSYVVLPSNFQYASARINYGSASEARILDYLGGIRANEYMDTKLAIMNPFPGTSAIDVSIKGTTETLHWSDEIEPYGMRWLSVSDLAQAKGLTEFHGDYTSHMHHRVVTYAFFYDRSTGLCYSADHVIPWIHRTVV